MAEEKKVCECASVQMLSRMSTAYTIWLDDMPRAEKVFAPLIDEMVIHLHEQFQKPGNKLAEKELEDTLNKIEQHHFDAQVGKLTFVRGMETLRNALHQNPKLRQVFICGTSSQQASDNPLNGEVFKALDILENGEPVDAKAAFDKIYTEHTCGA